jgi:Spy/CpxP family protein refolding chaperone
MQASEDVQMRILFSLMFVAAVGGAGPLIAQQPPVAPPRDAQRPMQMRQRDGTGFLGFGFAPERLIAQRDALNLTPEQVASLEKLAQETKQARDQAAEVAKSHQEQLQALWKADAPDPKALETNLQAIMDARQKAELSAATAAARAKGLLTAEQRGRVMGWQDARRMGQRQRMNRAPRGMWGRGERPGPQPRAFRRGPARS